jgi:hypothetical protein
MSARSSTRARRHRVLGLCVLPAPTPRPYAAHLVPSSACTLTALGVLLLLPLTAACACAVVQNATSLSRKRACLMWPEGRREGTQLAAEGLVVNAGSLAGMLLRAASMAPSSSAPPSCRSLTICVCVGGGEGRQCVRATQLRGKLLRGARAAQLPGMLQYRATHARTHLLRRPVPHAQAVCEVRIANPGLHRVELHQLHLQQHGAAAHGQHSMALSGAHHDRYVIWCRCCAQLTLAGAPAKPRSWSMVVLLRHRAAAGSSAHVCQAPVACDLF